MDKNKVKELSDLLFQFRNAFMSELTTEERRALVKTIMTVEFRTKQEEVIDITERVR